MAQITPSPSSFASSSCTEEKAYYAKAWLPLIQAMAEGKTIQRKQFALNLSNGDRDLGRYRWIDVMEFDSLTFRAAGHFRIKPEPKKQWYRAGLFKNLAGDFAVCVVSSDILVPEFEKSGSFVRWLTDRIEYELPEADHE